MPNYNEQTEKNNDKIKKKMCPLIVNGGSLIFFLLYFSYPSNWYVFLLISLILYLMIIWYIYNKIKYYIESK